MIVGYARTSTVDRTAGLDAQVRDLKAARCTKLFSEQVSSVADRAKLTQALKLRPRGRHAHGSERARDRAGDPVDGRSANRHADRDWQANGDHVRCHRGIRAGHDAGTPARGHRQGRGRGQIQGTAAHGARQSRRSACSGGPGRHARADRPPNDNRDQPICDIRRFVLKARSWERSCRSVQRRCSFKADILCADPLRCNGRKETPARKIFSSILRQ